ncbi:MAG TPA: hypothetical protein HA232_01485, partial [Methanocellales archaeon]|nr:hypothetical protein [Methanocellales archaeon]
SEALTIYGNVNAIFDKLVTALRLFKSGMVGFNIIKRKPMADIPIILKDPFDYSTGTYSPFSGQQYTLTETEVSEFRSFWDKFNKTKPFQIAPLGVAIRRFNYAYGRDKLEDKLMDYMIAFEALFFKQDEMGEFSHKLAVGVSRLLKQNYEERKDMMGK